ncbi:MAG: hypothetical protein J6W95_05835 [Bacteroidales bacterium]|nr:hypothetical protein [Bacteroidales bacterium]
MDHCFTALIERNDDMDAAYVRVPVNIREVKEYSAGSFNALERDSLGILAS